MGDGVRNVCLAELNVGERRSEYLEMTIYDYI